MSEDFFFEEEGPRILRPENELHVEINYKILYEDEWLMAVDKPAPLPVHSVGRFQERNLLSLLKRAGAGESASVVNRLDSETSGIVVIAKDSQTAGKLGIQFEKRLIHKEYLAVVLGNLDPKHGRIDLPLGPQIQWEHRMWGYDPLGKDCQTDYWVLEEKKDYSLVRVVPVTGRTHQIRAHFAAIGHPLAGDKIYIDPRIFDQYVRAGWQDGMLDTVKLPRLALHAACLRIRHPEFGDDLEFFADFPPQLQQFWESLPA